MNFPQKYPMILKDLYVKLVLKKVKKRLRINSSFIWWLLEG